MTESQFKRAEEIFKDRKGLEAEENLMDLLLDFWQIANRDYSAGKSHITAISCQEGTWTFFDKYPDEEISDTSSDCYQPMLRKCFETIRYIRQSTINSLMTNDEQEELRKIGFTIELDEDEERFVMSI